MSNVVIDRQKIDILANAISDKSGVPVTMTLAEMVEAVDGIEAGGGEPNLQAKTYTVDNAGTATITADSGYDGLSGVEVTVPSGTAGTPVAAKGTVSNHSIKITPGVTNQTGWITGSSKSGSFVTVNASELVSGSETKTANGTYDVTNLAELIVNVAGGGTSGLEFETGTWEPSSDIARGEITWSRTHTEAPVFVLLADMTGTADATTYSNYVFAWCDYYKLWGSGAPYSSSGFRYAHAYYTYRATSTSSTGSGAYVCTQNSDSTSSSGTTYPRYWVSPTNFHPYTNSTSRYWRAGRTYKWIAVWKPTT